MSVKADKVKSGYSDLSELEREDVKKFIAEFDKSGTFGQRNLSERARETFSKSLGPTSGNSCPCCGKS